MTESAQDPPFEETALYRNVYNYVETYMSRYDCSHDFNHVLRVLKHAKYILDQEQQAIPTKTYDERVVILAALLHDVGDRKYRLPDEDPEQLIADVLSVNNCPLNDITKIKLVVENVSYSHEMKNPEQVKTVIDTHPELAIVQDADRLDSIGAIGIGRVFAYGAAKAPGRGLQGSIDHFTEKLERVESRMKTATGRRLARERTERLTQFRGWWEDEVGF